MPGVIRSHPACAVFIGLALSLTCVSCGGPGQKPGTAGATGGAPLQAKVEFADLDSIHAALRGLHGRPVFVNFWATWCIPCVDELPALARLAREDDVARAGFIGISLDSWVTGNGAETEDKVRSALAKAGTGYPNLIYRGDQDPLIQGFELPGPIPYSVLYDARGARVRNWSGPAPIQEVRLAIALVSSPGDASSTGRAADRSPAAAADR
jgi:thiol-disulfide isomerase/thioredoxin